jgi:hypothetical protein
MMESIQTGSRTTRENIMAFVNDSAFEDDFRVVGQDATATLGAAVSESSALDHASSEHLDYAAKAVDEDDDLEDDEDEDEDLDDEDEDDLEDDDEEEEEEDDEDEDDDLEDDDDEDDEDEDLDDEDDDFEDDDDEEEDEDDEE